MGTLQFRKITKSLEDISFDCGVESINDYVRESYYPVLTQHAYTFSIMNGDIVLGYFQILFREIELEDFPEEISEYDPEIKRTISAKRISGSDTMKYTAPDMYLQTILPLQLL